MLKSTCWLGIIAFLATSCFAEAPRLPGTVIPEHYQIKITPDLASDSFAGEETISVRLTQPASSITLNAAEIKFGDVAVASGEISEPVQVTLDPKNEMATLLLQKPLAAGRARIHIVFAGTLNDKLRGFYRANANHRKYAATQFEGKDARRAFPCFDEPAMKSTFSLTLVVDKGDAAISNGAVLSDTPGPGPTKHTLAFSTTARISSYLVAMAVGDFECVQGGVDGIPIRVCATPDKREQGRFALEAAEHILHYYDQYFDIKYPFGKLDIVGVPDFAAGAMENPGAIFYRERFLLIDDKTASLDAHESVAGVLAHEMAHLWFGDLVTMKWWDDLWLNEGFATWMSGKPLRAWKPEWKGLDMGGVVDGDWVKSSRPLRAEDANLIYGKGSAVLRMMESYEGEQVFRAGVNAYLKAHAFGNVTSEDFWNAQAKVSGKPIDRIMPTFVDQPGAPLISIAAKRDGEQTSVTLSQRRFFRDRAAFAQGSPEIWQVPVCMRSAAPPSANEQAAQYVLLTQRTQTFHLDHLAPPVIANAGQKGYYIVVYPAEVLGDFDRIAETALTPAERIGLVNDVWAMVKAGMTPVGDFLSLAEALKSDRTFSVVDAYAGKLETIADDMAGDSVRENYRAWVRRILRPTAQELGWQPQPGESVETGALRSTVLQTLGQVGRDPETLETARTLARRYVDNPSVLDPTLADTVVNLAAIEGDAALYDEFLAALKTAKTPEVYYRFFYALTRFTNPALLIRTMEYALTPDVRGQDFGKILGALMANPAAADLTWDFARQHWKEINDKPPGNAGGAILGSTGVFCDGKHQEEVKDFFTEKKSDQSSIQRALEDIGSCTDVKSVQTPNLATWIHQHEGAASEP